ncbi:hypothetical protein QUW44_00435 [Limosilactobacillus pontis]|uniref:Uncharacterized protein n=1 Tax=Limosilactobacillus pontis TaxID=35787 RepID=A0ABT7UVT3_9LACO|nr:hypothetical protein [Limosilactobacillus pontis]MDM8265642.1 hypothetical protein [Limosilactobacillus pontis]
MEIKAAEVGDQIIDNGNGTKDDQQLHEVRKAMALIDDLEAVADKLPELPREKEVKDDTGESVDEVEKKEQHKVIDLQRKEN